jgi:hypothetical protein
MITLEDCLAMSGLTEDEIDAIAEHEHLPEMIAVELGTYLARRPGGTDDIRRMILDDIVTARSRGDLRHALQLRLVLMQFCREHPESGADGGPTTRRTA